jgi:putative ABC transport system substrate-binding protein
MAGRAGMTVDYRYVSNRDDYAPAFTAMREAGVQVLVVSANTHFVRDVGIIGALAQEARLPTVCEWKEMATSGCLFGYGPSLGELLRLSANYIARIFRGATPGELPIEQPANFEIGVNMKLARLLGIAVPPILLLRADEVTE